MRFSRKTNRMIGWFCLTIAFFAVVAFSTFIFQPIISTHAGGGQPAWQGTAGMPTSFLIEVTKGNVDGHRIVHKFGKATVGTTLTPICASLVYQVPKTAQALEFVSASANDTAAGTGAREITIVGLDENWQEVTQTLATNGVTAVALTTDLVRLYRWYVSTSGTYATQSAGSHAGILTIRAASAGATWSIIGITPFPIGQSEIGAYTVPIGWRAYVFIQELQVDSTKTVDAIFFQRTGANIITAPYSTMRAVANFIGISGDINPNTNAPQNGFTSVGEATDIGYMAKVTSATADISVAFEILLVKDGY